MRPAQLLSRRVRLRHMIVATTVAHHGSIREASAVLHLTQPAASRSVSELEEILGAQLFTRHAKGMAVTEAGALLLTHMNVAVAEVGSLMRHAAEIATGGRGEVRIGTLLAGTADVLPTALIEFTRRNPEVEVIISEGSPDRSYESLMLGQVDFVVGRVLPLATMSGVEAESLYEDEVRVICTPGHPRSGHRGTLGELVDDAWILPPRDTSLRRQIEEDFIRDCGRVPRGVIECVAALPLRPLVLGGTHLALAPAGVFTDELERGALVRLSGRLEGTSVPVGVMTRAGAELPSTAAAVISALRAATELRGNV